MKLLSMEDFLAHVGVKGMHWGVRKDSGGKLSPGSSKISPHSTKHMTNEQLRQRVERLRLDQQYSELSKPKKKAGHAYASEILKNSGKTAAGAVVSTVVGLALKKAFSGKPKAVKPFVGLKDNVSFT